MSKRKYRGTAQAEVAALTRQRIIDASLALYADHWIDEITLDQIAEKAGVTVQTILRHFGSKDGLAAAGARAANARATNQRDNAIAGDMDSIVANLVEHYEEVGDRVFRTLAQEEHFPYLKEFLKEGRNYHRQWVERVFADWLHTLEAERRERLVAQLIAVCDVYVWKILRRDQGFTSEQYRLALSEMLTALLSLSRGI